jgi:hypothetical protein
MSLIADTVLGRNDRQRAQDRRGVERRAITVAGKNKKN